MLKVRIHKTCALLRDSVELLLPTWFESLVWNRTSQILGRPSMNPQQVKIDFNQYPVYEGGATLLALLACPANCRSEDRNAGLHASLCGRALWASHLSNPENATRTTVKLQHVFRDAKVIDRETNFVARRLGERLVAGRMAIPFLQKAELGCQPRLPSAIKRLSGRIRPPSPCNQVSSRTFRQSTRPAQGLEEPCRRRRNDSRRADCRD